MLNLNLRPTKKKPLVLLIVFLIISFWILMFFKSYTTPTLIGKWQSKETGQYITFKKSGLVKISNSSQVGNYRIISSSMMEYTIDGKTFNLIYQLEGRTLLWGINSEHLETFSKKSLF